MPAGRTPLIPQPGFQYKYLTSQADIAFGGGGAGGGKTYALLMEAARHRWHPRHASMVFRRQYTEIKNPGGLWDEANNIYGTSIGGRPVDSTWHFPKPEPGARTNARVVFSHLQHAKDVMQHHGGQYPLICFDEIQTFLESQFWYLLSRNRTTIGVKPYVRATCNPVTSGFVKDLVQWWLYPDDHPDPALAGYPIPERDGVLRYFARDKGVVFWGDTPREVVHQVPHLFAVDDGIPLRAKIKSFTFIQGNVYDNKELIKKDPGYVGNLLAQGEDERNRLLHGCWKYRPGGEELFDYDTLLDGFTNDFVPKGRGARDRFITADIAMEGSDLFVVGVWDGWRLIKVIAYEKSPGPTIVAAIKELASQYGVPRQNIVFDRDGVGGFLAGYLPGAYGFNNGGAVIKGPHDLEKPNYENLKAQCAYLLAEQFNRAGIYIEPGALQDWMRDRIIEDCRAHLKRDADKGGKLKISRKAEVYGKLKRSPDFFDMLLMRMVFTLRRSRPSSTA